MGPLHPILPLDMICHSTRWVNSPSMVPRSLFAGGSLAPVLVEFVYGERSAHAVRLGAGRHAVDLEQVRDELDRARQDAGLWREEADRERARIANLQADAEHTERETARLQAELAQARLPWWRRFFVT